MSRKAVETTPGDTPLSSSSGFRSLLATLVVVAFVMCILQVIVGPIYVALSGNRLALFPWIGVACLLSVAFCVVVGLLLLWVARRLERHASSRFAPFVDGAIGFVAFGAWGGSVVPAVFDSIVALDSGQGLRGLNFWAVVINCAVIGGLAFFLGRVISSRVQMRWPIIASLAAVSLLLAVSGIVFLSILFSHAASLQ